MSASFIFKKFIGQDGIFGNPVSSIGLKRVDQVVPAVYGNPIMPGDDASDANTYCVYRNEDPSCMAHSFESVFKIVLANPPSNQVSNMRLWPSSVPDCDPEAAGIFIGNSICYYRPSNRRSEIAKYPLFSYTRENPFYVTVNGNWGQKTDCRVTSQVYQLSVRDLGHGNVFFVNGDRQMPLLLVPNNTYTLVNNMPSLLNLMIFDMHQNEIISPYITTSVVGGQQIVTIVADPSLLANYPYGMMYGAQTNPGAGGTMSWELVTVGNTQTFIVDVEVRTSPGCGMKYWLNGVEQPQLILEQNQIYEFHNPYGANYPFRFVKNGRAFNAANECDVAFQGITVYDGGTANEIVVVDTANMYQSGPMNWAWGYQAVTADGLGNILNLRNTCLIGNYNLNTIGAGTANPMAAGETDFIYMQMNVGPMTPPGFVLPDIIIEWDES